MRVYVTEPATEAVAKNLSNFTGDAKAYSIWTLQTNNN
jgi:hypothetical protein